MVDSEILRWELKRERESRQLAEQLLFQKEQELQLLKKQLLESGNSFVKQTDEIYSIAMFPMEAPEPMLRISLDGKIILQNPASFDLKRLTYNNKEFTSEEFWHYVVKHLAATEDKWEMELTSNNRNYIFTCKSFADDGYINVYGSDVTDKIEAQKKVKESEQRWQALSENIPGISYEFTYKKDKTGYFSYLSKKVEEIFGIAPKNFKADIIHPDDRKKFEESFIRALETKEPFYEEARVINGRGETRWHSSACTFMYEKENGDSIFSGIMLDITERKLAAENLKQAQERWRFALEGAGDGLWEFDLAENKAFFSLQFKRMIGYDEDEFNTSGNTWLHHVHLDDLEKLKSIVAKYLSGEISKHSLEYRFKCKNGNYIWVLNRGMVLEKTEEGKAKKIIGTHTDITNRKRLEEALETTANRFSNLIINMNEAVLVTNELGKIVLVNDKFCTMFRFPKHPETLATHDCIDTLTTKKDLFKYSTHFAERIHTIHNSIEAVSGEVFELVNEEVFALDFSPIFIDSECKGHLWKFSDITEKMNIEKKLIEQRRFYEEILNNVPADIAVFDTNHRYLFVNPIAIRDAEIRKWIIGKTDFDFCKERNKPVELARKREAIFNTLLQTRTQQEWEEEMITATGAKQYHLRRMFPVIDADNIVKFVIGYGFDITERKKFEEQTKLSEKRYRDLFNFSQALICTHDITGKVINVNPAVCNLLGYSESEMVGRLISDFIPEKERAIFNETYLHELSRSGKASGVFTVVSKSGNKIYLLYQNYKVEEPGIEPYIIGFSQDISERIKAEEALQKSEEKYRSIIENMNLGLVEMDPESTITFANNNVCKMGGYNNDELIGKKLYNIFTTGESRHFIKQKMYLRNEGVSEVYEVLINNKQGEKKWWLVSGTPILSNSGKIKGSIGICLDITAQKQLEQQLRESKVLAEQSARAKESFLANMSHEIRTPMNAILGMGKQLQKTRLDNQQQFYLEAITNAAGNLLVIINDILDFSKIDAGKLTLENIGFRLSEIVRNVMQIIEHKAEEKGLVITSNIDTTIAPVLMGDPYRVNQVLINLLNNAIKFTEQGSVTINCSVTENASDQQQIQIEIIDTGIGMSEEFQKVLFTKFLQEDDTREKKYGGTGLGMSIVKELVELMKGSVRVASKKNAGTTITLQIPFVKGTDKDMPVKNQQATDSTILKNKNILLVEDNEMNRMLASIILDQYGAVVGEAVNGKEAVDKLRSKNYDLVLMDMRMPVMDGLEATNIIRKEISHSIPVIALTANAVSGEKEKCIQAGMNDFIAKPFEEEELVRLTAKWLGLETLINTTQKNKLMTNDSLFSIDRLKEITKGNDDFIKKMLTVFISETNRGIAEINEGYASNNLKQISATAHRLKASVSEMKVNSIKEDILQLEALERNPCSPDQIQTMVSHVTTTLENVVTGLNKMIEENSF